MVFNQSEFELVDLSILIIFTIRLSKYSGALVVNYREFTNLLPGYIKLIKFRAKLKNNEIFNNYNFDDNKKNILIKNTINSFVWKNSDINIERINKLSLDKNNPLIIVGKSGAGKTNLIDIVCGLKNARSSSWEINFDKSKNKKFSNDIGAIEFRKHISYIPQDSIV